MVIFHSYVSLPEGSQTELGVGAVVPSATGMVLPVGISWMEDSAIKQIDIDMDPEQVI